MPIVSTQSVSKEIKSLLFVNDGSLNVTLLKMEDGQVSGDETYRIEAEDTSTILDVAPTEGLTVRQQIILSVYQYLINKGLVSGAIEA